MFESSKNLIIFVLCIGLAVLLYLQFGRGAGPTIKRLSPEEAVSSTLAYINENILKGAAEARLVGDIKEERGLYKFQMKVGGESFPSYVTKDGKLFFPQAIDLENKEQAEATPQGTPEEGGQAQVTLGDFSVSKDEVCREEGKPIVYFFGSQWCPHCKWEHPIVQNVAQKFKNYIAFHNNMDSEADRDVFSKYSPGGVPTLVLGCKYYRVGSGEQDGETEETKNLTALICKLTDNQPASACAEVKDLINQIEE